MGGVGVGVQANMTRKKGMKMIFRGCRDGSVSKHFWPGQHEDLSLTPRTHAKILDEVLCTPVPERQRQRQEDSWGSGPASLA